jgi:hypothetical protein
MQGSLVHCPSALIRKGLIMPLCPFALINKESKCGSLSGIWLGFRELKKSFAYHSDIFVDLVEYICELFCGFLGFLERFCVFFTTFLNFVNKISTHDVKGTGSVRHAVAVRQSGGVDGRRVQVSGRHAGEPPGPTGGARLSP